MRLTFGDILFFVFLVLKLTENIDWSWWWVTAPLWASVALRVFINITTKDEPPKKSKWIQRLEQLQAEQSERRKRQP